MNCENYAECKVSSNDQTGCQCQKTCTNEPYPVCGSNRLTYPNLCSLKRDSCLKQELISVKNSGSCSKSIFCLFMITYRINVKIIMHVFFIAELLLDLVFALDGSERLAKKGFERIKDLVKAMVDNYTISETETHVGVVEFSDEANVILPLNKLFESTSIKDQVQRIIPSGGKDRVTDEALRKSADNVFDAKSGGRPGASKVLIIVTDGKSTGKEPPKRAVKPVKEKGVRVYVVSIGEDTDKDELKDIVPTDENMYPVKNPDEAPSVAPKLVEDIKKDIKKGKLCFNCCKTIYSCICV